MVVLGSPATRTLAQKQGRNGRPNWPPAAVAVGGETLVPPEPGEADEAVLFAFDNTAIPFTANLVLAPEPPTKYHTAIRF